MDPLIGTKMMTQRAVDFVMMTTTSKFAQSVLTSSRPFVSSLNFAVGYIASQSLISAIPEKLKIGNTTIFNVEQSEPPLDIIMSPLQIFMNLIGLADFFISPIRQNVFKAI